MATETFFLKDIRTEGYRKSLSRQEQYALDEYLDEMNLGPGDGDMDIDWQATGKGYYVHLHYLESLPEGPERRKYVETLQEDIKLWLEQEQDNYMVTIVKDQLNTH